MSKTVRQFSPEVHERAVRMALEHQGGYASNWEAVHSIASKIGGDGETLPDGTRRGHADQNPAGQAIAPLNIDWAKTPPILDQDRRRDQTCRL